MAGGLRRFLAWRLALLFPWAVFVTGAVTALLLGELPQLFSRPLIPTLALGLLVAGALGAVLGWAIATRVTHPVAELIRGARRLAAGEFDKRVHVDGPDELVTLARTFNEMAGRLQATLRELHSEQARLVTVLGAMPSGVLLIDASGRLQLTNPAARRLLDVSRQALGRHYISVVRHYPLTQLIERSMGSGQAAEADVILPTEPGQVPRHVHATVVPLAPASASEDDTWTGSSTATDVSLRARPTETPAGVRGGVVVVLHDISEIRRVEQMRRDFVANVSHELRTPVTAIQGFAETLLEGVIREDAETAEHFAAVIHREADRMARLVEDLLDLARLESPEPGLQKEILDLRESARQAVDRLRPHYEAAGVHLRLDLADEAVPVWADRDRLDQVWTNLLDNAHQHTPAGGTVVVRVRCQGGPGGAEAVGEVEDTGRGIPPAALPRIFERFYRVDPGRSRSAGGTGLGLAIVKHVIEAHGGTVEAESQVGKGTRIRFRIPLASPAQPEPQEGSRGDGERVGPAEASDGVPEGESPGTAGRGSAS